MPQNADTVNKIVKKNRGMMRWYYDTLFIVTPFVILCFFSNKLQHFHIFGV